MQAARSHGDDGGDRSEQDDPVIRRMEGAMKRLVRLVTRRPTRRATGCRTRRARPLDGEARVDRARARVNIVLVVTLLAAGGGTAAWAQSSDSAFGPQDSSRFLARISPSFVWADSLRRIAEGEEPAEPREPEKPEGPRRLFSFDPHPSSRCVLFPVMESTGNYLGNEEHKIDQWLFTDALGLMVNLRGWSLGGAGELRFARGHVDAVPSLRVRRWLVGDQSLEASLEYAPRGTDWPTTRLVGPAASLRYSFNPYGFVQVGTCRFRETRAVFFDPNTGVQRSDSREFSKNYVGLGWTGRAGAALWGMQAVLAGLAFLVFAALSGVNMS
jgi:hypothetical protein